MRRGNGRRAAAIGAFALAGLASLSAGCGEEQTLTASEFVDRVNEEGVAVSLGRMRTGGEAKELYDIRLPPLPGLPPPAPGEHAREGLGANGTLYVFDDADGAEEQLAGCRDAADLTCFQAGNLVVLFGETSIEAQRLGVAIRRMGD